MKIYHYGFNEKIITEGIDASIKREATEAINELIYDIYENYFGRDCCVFFNFDKRDVGDILFSVEVEELNEKLLYVANQYLADKLYDKWYKGYNSEDLAVEIKEYVSSIIPFKEYNNQYENPELFYLDSIEPSLLKVEYSYL